MDELKIGTRRYDVDICRHVGTDPDDYETVYIEAADSYAEAVRLAKEWSLLKEWNGIPVFETHVTAGIVTDDTDFELRYIRSYRQGKFYDKF